MPKPSRGTRAIYHKDVCKPDNLFKLISTNTLNFRGCRIKSTCAAKAVLNIPDASLESWNKLWQDMELFYFQLEPITAETLTWIERNALNILRFGKKTFDPADKDVVWWGLSKL